MIGLDLNWCIQVAMPDAFISLGPNMLAPDQMNMAPMEVQAEEKKAVMKTASRWVAGWQWRRNCGFVLL